MGSNYRNTSESANILKDQGTISKETAKVFGAKKNRKVEVPSIGRRGDPIFQFILIDSSGSMQVCKQGVINSQPIMIDALRESSACKRKRLSVGQYLFNSTSQQLHSVTQLSTDKSDHVVLLDSTNYHPAGSTALYSTVFKMLQDILVIIDSTNDQGVFARFGIAVITDGEDNEGGAKPKDIQRFLQELEANEHLINSVVVGLLNDRLSSNKLEDIKNTLGFKDAIPCGQNSPKEIRRAFVLASQSTVK